MLSDPCWEEANEIRLQESKQQDGVTDRIALVMIAYDDEYFYVAGSFPKYNIPYAEVTTAGRQHDQAAAGFDRLRFCIDLDADYHSSYQLTFDQRGQVSESCINDSRWDPQLYVAVVQDDAYWRLEGAIPFEELSPHPPKPGQSWAISVQRIIPSTGIQSWSFPAAEELLPSSFGTVRFGE
ncbi:MAG: hypothetical protein R3C11_15605 [Planctomycetaceae bacterium]